MVQSRPARKVQLSELREKFGLCRSDEASFFTEWETDLPGLTVAEQERLDQVRAHYLYLLEYPVLESIVKMVVLSPVLELAGFYNPPFRVAGEVGVQVTAKDGDEGIQGNIDVLVVQQQFWVTVIEAKNEDLERGFVQLAIELIALDQWIESDQPVLQGAISTGNVWQFGQFVRQSRQVTQDLDLYRVPADVEELLRVVIQAL